MLNSPTQTPDDQAVVEALAKAGTKLDIRHNLPYGRGLEILNDLRANPDILRSMGIGRLPTRSALYDLGNWDGEPWFSESQATEMIRAGFAVEDPAPADPDIDAIKAEIATWTPERRKAALVALTAAAEFGRKQK